MCMLRSTYVVCRQLTEDVDKEAAKRARNKENAFIERREACLSGKLPMVFLKAHACAHSKAARSNGTWEMLPQALGVLGSTLTKMLVRCPFISCIDCHTVLHANLPGTAHFKLLVQYIFWNVSLVLFLFIFLFFSLSPRRLWSTGAQPFIFLFGFLL